VEMGLIKLEEEFGAGVHIMRVLELYTELVGTGSTNDIALFTPTPDSGTSGAVVRSDIVVSKYRSDPRAIRPIMHPRSHRYESMCSYQLHGGTWRYIAWIWFNESWSPKVQLTAPSLQLPAALTVLHYTPNQHYGNLYRNVV
jgi:hypothetical protein